MTGPYMRYMGRFVLSLLLFSIMASFAMAQSPSPYFKNYTVDDGLASMEVHDAIQDDKGFVWFATDNGLSRFDGYEFTNFGPNEGLDHHVVLYLFKKGDGAIRAITLKGQIYDIRDGKIIPYEYNDLIDTFSSNGGFVVDYLWDERSDVVYLSFNKSKILAIDSEGGRQLLNSKGENGVKFFANIEQIDSINSLLGQGKQDCFQKEGICFVQDTIKVGGRLTYNTIGANASLLSLKNGTSIWYMNNQLLKFNGCHLESRSTIVDKVRSKNFLDLGEKGIMMGGAQSGNNILNYDLDGIASPISFLNGKKISSLFQDEKLGIWATSVENGIYYAPTLEVFVYDESAGINSPNVTNVAVMDSSNFVIELDNARLLKMSTDPYEIYTYDLPIEKSEELYDMYIPPGSNKLYVTSTYGILECQNGNCKVLMDRISDKPLYTFKRLYSGHGGKVLGTGAYYFGYFHPDSLAHKFNSVQVGIRKRTLCAYSIDEQTFLLGGVDGLMRYNMEQEQITVDSSICLVDDRVEAIRVDSQGRIILATKGQGVIICDGQQRLKYDKSRGLSSDMIEDVYIDSEDRVWVASSNGLNLLRPTDEGYAVRQFDESHGLPSIAVNKVASDGIGVWLATSKGLINFEEPSMSQDKMPPVIEAVLVDGGEQKFSYPEAISASSQRLVEFKYVGLNYRQFSKVKYRFRINNEGWQETFGRSVHFVNLSPNDYLFEVQMQNEDGVWSDSAYCKYTVLAPWWAMWYMKIFYVLSFLALVYFWNTWRIKRHFEKSQLKKELNDLEAAALNAQMNSHFVFNSLNSIQSYVVQNKAQLASIYLARFAALIRYALNSTSVNRVPIKEEIKFIEDYLFLERMRSNDSFSYEVHVDSEKGLDQVFIPPLLIQPVVENAVIHGVRKLSEGTGRIIMSVSITDEHIHILVDDNGPGLNAEAQREGSHGLSIVENRCRVLGEANYLKVENLRDVDGVITGARSSIFIERNKLL